jgi:hypothetical protein
MRQTKLIGVTAVCLLCLCSAAYAQGEVNGDPVVRKLTYQAVTHAPKLGAKISEEYPKPTDSIASKSGERYDVYHVLFNHVEYSVRADASGHIRYVMTTDRRFKTAEGVTEGMTFREVRVLAKGEPVKEDYGFDLRLDSGWKAAFRTKAEGEGLADEKVSWLFKEND